MIETYYVEILTVSNCFTLRTVATVYTLKSLKTAADLCVLQNFADASRAVGFCNLDLNEVETFISSDELTVSSVDWNFEFIKLEQNLKCYNSL